MGASDAPEAPEPEGRVFTVGTPLAGGEATGSGGTALEDPGVCGQTGAPAEAGSSPGPSPLPAFVRATKCSRPPGSGGVPGGVLADVSTDLDPLVRSRLPWVGLAPGALPGRRTGPRAVHSPGPPSAAGNLSRARFRSVVPGDPRRWPPGQTLRGGSGRRAGPCRTSPSMPNREPWQGHSHTVSASLKATRQPRCVQRADTAWAAPSSSR